MRLLVALVSLVLLAGCASAREQDASEVVRREEAVPAAAAGESFRLVYRLVEQGNGQVLGDLAAKSGVQVWNELEGHSPQQFPSVGAEELQLVQAWVAAHPGSAAAVTVKVGHQGAVYLEGRWADGQFFIIRLQDGALTGFGVSAAPLDLS